MKAYEYIYKHNFIKTYYIMPDKNLKTYTKAEVEKATLQYFKGDELATDVWIGKYALKDDKNYLELTPDDMHRRLAREFSKIENNYINSGENLSEYGQKRDALTEEKIFNYFKNFKYISPQGSIMNMLGNKNVIGSLSNCVVLPKIFDSYGGILFADQQLVQLFKRRCGAGIDISTLRPTNFKVTNAAGTSTGAVSFMERFSNTTREVGQCLFEDTLILTKLGLKEIKYVNSGDYVWTENEWVKVVNTVRNRKKTFKVTTKYGNEIIASKDHVFHTMDGEKSLKEFNVGDQITMIWGNGNENNKYVSLYKPNLEGSGNRLAEHNLPEILDKDLGYILGYMYGDGSLHRKISKTTGNQVNAHISLACTLDRPEIAEKLKILWKKIFNIELNTKKCDGEWEVLSISSQQVYKFLLENDIAKQKAGNLIFPENILKSPLSVQLSFIGGYFDADGYASDKKKGYVFTSIDKNFLLKIKYILSSLGILTKIHDEDRSDKNWRTLYSLCVLGASSKIKLKSVLIESLKLERATLSANRDCFLSIYKANDLTDIKNHHTYSYVPDKSQYLSVNVLRRLNEDSVNTKIENPVLYQDFIKEITEYENESNVYDLVLIDTHLFWANGFYAHNSGRRGALMISMDVRHPDIFDFVKIKRDLKKVTGSNISVMLRDDFMNAVEKNEKYSLRFPVDSNIEDAVLVKEINAVDLWNEIIKSAHLCAEPGLIFKDRQHFYSTSSIYPNWTNISTNPCSEIAMNDDSCRLMVINYFGCVENPFTEYSKFNFEKLYEISYEGQRLIDDLVDLELSAVEQIIEKINNDPEPDYVKTVELQTWKNLYNKGKAGRRTGLGFTALGDTLAGLGLKYDSNEGIELIEKISKVKFIAEFDSSIDMAIQRGKFEDFNPKYENESEFVLMIKNEYPDLYDRMMMYGRRNISISTVAPVGSLSMLTQTTSGIEPLFMIGYKRRKKINYSDKNVRIDFVDDMGDTWMEFDVLHPKVKEWLNINNIYDISLAYTNSPYVGSTASEIDWMKRIRIQSIIQKYVTHSISSTINLPKDVDIQKVSDIYLEAWKMKLKGITVYRDGSRDGILFSNTNLHEEIEFRENHAPKRPKRLKAEIHRFQNNLEKWIAVVGIKDGRPYEIFTGKNENGLTYLPVNIKECEVVKQIFEVEEPDETGKMVKVRKKRYDIEYVDSNGEKQVHTGLNHAFNPEYWNYAKLISGILRHGMPLIKVYELIDSLTFREENINTWKNGVVRVVKKYIKDGERTKGKCPECGGVDFIFEEGCMKCKNCSWTKCS